ncbi:hypothetical protein AVEN_212594-1 [Araneus ventricosus]|uniref:Uncharacterized protein n=1 Tax=Araneus ventricosus TaxID=182803 RepID=A0A4Y2VUP4_ARAVE|nr:hypothetical protein AVEN_212594-1 [Araneus ventricosus]
MPPSTIRLCEEVFINNVKVILTSRFLKQREGYLGMDIVMLNRCQMTRATPEPAPPSPSFRATPSGERLATTYDLAYSRPHTRRVFGGIGFRTCDPPVMKSRPCH